MKMMLDGAQRECSAGETLLRMRPHFAAAGITRVGLITGLDRLGIPVAQSVRPDAVMLSVDSGKGATDEQAMCSAAMEGFERAVGERWVPCDVVRLERLNDACETRWPRVTGAPNRVLPGIEWAPVQGIFSGREWLVPVQVLRMRSDLGAFDTFSCGSNGLSAGNTEMEALVGGLYEVIERDAVHMWMTGTRARRVERIVDPVAQELAGRIEGAGCRLLLLDLTGDVGVPTYEAYIFDFEDPFAASAHGSGAHLSPGVAMCRAICEAAQARAVWMAGSRDDVSQEKFRLGRGSDARAAYEELAGMCDEVADDREDASGRTFSEDAERLVEMVERAGFPEPLAVRMAHDFPCSVVRVMVPGMAGYFIGSAKWGRPVGGGDL